MTAHTPGQWEALIEGVSTHGADEHTVVAGEHMACVALIPIASSAETHGEAGSTEISEAEAIANARLIAAAPELLEACKSFLIAMRTSGASNGAIREAEELAHAAIAKATGKQA